MPTLSVLTRGQGNVSALAVGRKVSVANGARLPIIEQAKRSPEGFGLYADADKQSVGSMRAVGPFHREVEPAYKTERDDR